MENRNIFDYLTQYRLKVEKNGEAVADIPSLLCLPALLAAPRMGIAGMIAAPLLGYNVRLEANGKTVTAEDVVQKAADAAATAAKSVREEIDRVFAAVSEEDDPADNAADAPAEEAAEEPAPVDQSKEILEDLEEHEKEPEVPVIHVNPDDSTKA